MKQLFSTLSLISFIGVLALSIIVFNQKEDQIVTNESNTELSSKAETNINRASTGQYAYIDVQRIMLEYAFYNEIAKELEGKQRRAETEFSKKAEDFKKEYENYMKKAQMGSFLSQASQQQQENELRVKQENLAALEQELSLKLQEDMKLLNDQATDTIMNFLKSYNQKAQYDFILNSATILEPGTLKDITDEVIVKLNENYHKNKK